MKLKQLVKNFLRKEGCVRVIDKNGDVISENWNTGITVDFISAEYLVSIGELEDVHSKVGERVSVPKTSSTS